MFVEVTASQAAVALQICRRRSGASSLILGRSAGLSAKKDLDKSIKQSQRAQFPSQLPFQPTEHQYLLPLQSRMASPLSVPLGAKRLFMLGFPT